MSDVQIHPYVMFQNQAREAMGFYQEVFGGELTMQTYAEGGMSGAEVNDERIMHAQLETPHGLLLMAADVPDGVPYQPGSVISISLHGGDDPALRRFFAGLSGGGTVIEPLTEAPWGDVFGACADRFGISWMVNIAGDQSS